MQILVNVNQKKCFASGIDAQSSTMLVDVDPALLDAASREMIAENIRESHKLYSIDSQSFDICPPNYDGFIAELERHLQIWRDKKAKYEQKKDAAINEILSKDTELLLSSGIDDYSVDNTENFCGYGYGTQVRKPVLPYSFNLNHITVYADDPRLLEKMAELKTVFAEKLAHWEEQKAAYDAWWSKETARIEAEKIETKKNNEVFLRKCIQKHNTELLDCYDAGFEREQDIIDVLKKELLCAINIDISQSSASSHIDGDDYRLDVRQYTVYKSILQACEDCHYRHEVSLVDAYDYDQWKDGEVLRDSPDVEVKAEIAGKEISIYYSL